MLITPLNRNKLWYVKNTFSHLLLSHFTLIPTRVAKLVLKFKQCSITLKKNRKKKEKMRKKGSQYTTALSNFKSIRERIIWLFIVFIFLICCSSCLFETARGKWKKLMSGHYLHVVNLRWHHLNWRKTVSELETAH